MTTYTFISNNVTCIFSPGAIPDAGVGPSDQYIDFSSYSDTSPSVPVTVTFDKPISEFSITVVGLTYGPHTTTVYSDDGTIIQTILTHPSNPDIGNGGGVELISVTPSVPFSKVVLTPPDNDYLGYRNVFAKEFIPIFINEGVVNIVVDKTEVLDAEIREARFITIPRDIEIINESTGQAVATFSANDQINFSVSLSPGSYRISPHLTFRQSTPPFYYIDQTLQGNSFVLLPNRTIDISYFIGYSGIQPPPPPPPPVGLDPAFALSVTPNTVTTNPGKSTTFNVDILRTNYTDEVRVDISSGDINVTFSPSFVITKGNSAQFTMTVSTQAPTPTKYTFSVVGQGINVPNAGAFFDVQVNASTPQNPTTINLSDIITSDTVTIQRTYKKGSMISLQSHNITFTNTSDTIDATVTMPVIRGVSFTPTAFSLSPKQRQMVTVSFDMVMVEALPVGVSPFTATISLTNPRGS